MYEELINRLRASVDGRNEKCDGCPYEEDYPCCVDCLDKMHKQAADAIEKLQNKLSLSDETGKALCHSAHKLLDEVPRWIPVTERLPQYGERVLVFGGVTMYVAYYDKNRYGGESWHKLNSKSHYCNPTHWMPLPEPPKEETE